MSNITQYPLELEHKLNGFHFKKQPSIKIRRYLERVKKKKSTEEFDRYWNVKLSLVDKIEAYCTRVESANGADFQMTVNIKKLIIDYDGRMNNITHCDLGGGNSFWQGTLSMYPWHELGMEEESILGLILHNHVFTNGRDVFFDFNKQSSIDKFLRKNWAGEATVNVVMILRRVVAGAIEMVEKDDDRYPRYVKITSCGYCSKCDSGFYEDSGRCPECKTVLKYS